MSYLVIFEADAQGLMPITLAQEDKMFKDAKFKTILIYRASCRPAWTADDLASKTD